MATWASAVASRARTSSSCRRINSSPANTLSVGLTSTSPMAAMAGAAILTSPDHGSTRPGATACHRLGSSPVRWLSCARMAGANATLPSTSRHPTRKEDVACMNLPLICRSLLSLHPLALDHDAAFFVISAALFAAALLDVAALFTDDAPILDADDALGERHDAGVMRHHQH